MSVRPLAVHRRARAFSACVGRTRRLRHNGGWRTETLVIATDSANRLRATCVQNQSAYVNRSLNNHSSWGTPNFRDGITSTLENPTHTYTTPGNYTVSLAVEDAGGNVKTAAVASYVTVQPLAADFTAPPTYESIYLVDSGWTETGIDWTNAPVIGGTALGTLRTVNLGTWVEVPAWYSSREGVAGPQLVLR